MVDVVSADVVVDDSTAIVTVVVGEATTIAAVSLAGSPSGQRNQIPSARLATNQSGHRDAGHIETTLRHQNPRIKSLVETAKTVPYPTS